MLKYKILAKLQKKFSGVRKDLLGLVADKMAIKVTEENEIDAAIEALDDLPISITDFANQMQQEGDRRYAAGKKDAKPKEEHPNEDDPNEDDPQDPPPPPKKPGKGNNQGGNQNSELAKLTQMVANLTTQFTAMQQSGTQKTIAEQIAAKAKVKGIPAIFVKGRMVEKVEDIDGLIEEIAVDYAAHQQELANQGWAQATPPAGGGNNQQTKGSQKVDPDVVNFSKAQAEQANKSQK